MSAQIRKIAIMAAHVSDETRRSPALLTSRAVLRVCGSDARKWLNNLVTSSVENLAPQYQLPKGEAPLLPVKLAKVEHMTGDVAKYEFASFDGTPLPKVEAGAHIDVVVAPEFFRQYSLSGDPADASKYQIAVLREDEGRGGSKLMHRIFREGRKVFISRPINHFPLAEDATRTLLFGGGIGVTPLIGLFLIGLFLLLWVKPNGEQVK